MLSSKHGDRDAFLVKYNPDCQLAQTADAEECHFGDHPTLSQLRVGYGSRMPVIWLLPQLYSLSEYCGCKNKLQGRPLQECASIIAADFHWLKVSELILFFHRFKSGCYGRFYGTVDPLVITTALRDFCDERWQAYAKHEQEQREQREREQEARATSWEEHCMRTYGELRPHPLSRFTNSQYAAVAPQPLKKPTSK